MKLHVGSSLKNEDGVIFLYVRIVGTLKRFIGTKMIKHLSTPTVKGKTIL
ncbi:hypothetical protein EZS27_018271 [termite gut metagenome]|uniref:Uncharacterized protein n=1 Tax=termite gut metagenome TaxID=433724 RepID=A0A5J4RID7_9ZZZZ